MSPVSSNALQLALARLPWVLRVFFIAAFALVAARTVNLFTAEKIRPAVKYTPATGPLVPKVARKLDLDADGFARMMGMQLPTPVVVAEDEGVGVDGKPAAPKPDDMTSEPVRTTLHAQLLATVVANRPEWSIATLRDLNLNQDDVYMIDDVFMGSRVLTIDKLRVVFVVDGHRECLDLTPANMVATAGPPKPAGEPAPASGEGIKKIDDHHYQIERSTVNNALGNLNDLAMQARIVPSFKNGQANGFKLFSIKPDSLYSQIGIQNGDVIQRINGLDINSPDKALEAYGKLKSANALDLSVERNGQTLSYHYAIQ